MGHVFGSEFRRVLHREHLGKPAIVAVAIRNYDTTIDDLWNAITKPERLALWFLPVEGNLELGGRYQLKGNACGTITRCERPEALDLTWEVMGGTSWVNVRLMANGKKAQLTLEHIAHKDGIGEEHLRRFGPSAVGIGWDLGLYGLEKHLAAPTARIDQEGVDAWTRSSEGRAFVRGSGEAWGEADAAAGGTPEEAQAKAERTIAFYSGG
jgi:uncharacterized protein YndB with AHSA1/START domain